MCRVTSLVKRCDTCLWLLSAWCWLVVSSSEVLPELRCIAWLPCVLVRFPRNVCCCPGEGFSQDCFTLISVVAVLPQSLRCAVGLASAFWQVFLERCLGVLVEVLQGPACVASAVLLTAVFSLMVCVVWSLGCAFWLRFLPGLSFVASGGGSSQECSVFVSGHRCVAPAVQSVSFGWAAFWRGVVRLAMRLDATLASLSH
ncbi:hypothetical protein Taro_042911 [Colocasia esculenta]|uniref:Uncharacterized protein n=1 Tax=Colocasia esculenta TaxID=4460 RepID=A0A843X0G6_COLES|nr:hypothetical protein [Colocasia esculenta]